MKVLIDNGHGWNTPGKCSPNHLLEEYNWARAVAARIGAMLKNRGVDVTMLTPEVDDVSITNRVKRANRWCEQLGKNNVLLVSIHVNAAGGDGKWHSAKGWSVFVSKNASDRSKDAAEVFYKMAKERGMLGNRSVPAADEKGRHYWTWSWRTGDIGILAKSNCPALLTENFFMDNEDDCKYLMSEEGKMACTELHVDAIMKIISNC